MLFIDLLKDKWFLQRHIGDISQVVGLKRYVFAEGKARGMEAVDVKTGVGFNFTVLPGRGMDIIWRKMIGKAEYVLGMKPGNCNLIGRSKQKRKMKWRY